MRFIYSLLVVVLAAIVAIFAFQNLKLVTISFLAMRIELPVALLVVGVYFLGLLTGGALLALVRSVLRGARQRH
ncbi:LapA family protein [Algiphilus aromaticivorans]|jgi:uncharacterized integral membrane protein|uniref:DUF1049 domain-containing protein n=1 Tax=Algiphilus aromaticivorans TaxID=382454 RepID=UPI0005C23748|nr:DUF1049 domain-containing protein [Algiphilus aromaticivorans]